MQDLCASIKMCHFTHRCIHMPIIWLRLITHMAWYDQIPCWPHNYRVVTVGTVIMMCKSKNQKGTKRRNLVDQQLIGNCY